MMPADPAAHLILRAAKFDLRVLEAAFDPEALRLHISKPLPRRTGCRIAQGVFEGAVVLAHYQQAGTGDGVFLSHTQTGHTHTRASRAYGRCANCARKRLLCKPGGGQSIHAHRGAAGRLWRSGLARTVPQTCALCRGLCRGRRARVAGPDFRFAGHIN